MAGITKVDMESLIHQGMISIDGNTYSVMIRNKSIIDFPNLRKVRVDIESNWLYKVATQIPKDSSKE